MIISFKKKTTDISRFNCTYYICVCYQIFCFIVSPYITIITIILVLLATLIIFRTWTNIHSDLLTTVSKIVRINFKYNHIFIYFEINFRNILIKNIFCGLKWFEKKYVIRGYIYIYIYTGSYMVYGDNIRFPLKEKHL